MVSCGVGRPPRHCWLVRIVNWASRSRQAGPLTECRLRFIYRGTPASAVAARERCGTCTFAELAALGCPFSSRLTGERGLFRVGSGGNGPMWDANDPTRNRSSTPAVWLSQTKKKVKARGWEGELVHLRRAMSWAHSSLWAPWGGEAYERMRWCREEERPRRTALEIFPSGRKVPLTVDASCHQAQQQAHPTTTFSSLGPPLAREEPFMCLPCPLSSRTRRRAPQTYVPIHHTFFSP